MNNSSNSNTIIARTVGLDLHPDSFTTAIVVGDTPAKAQVQKTFNKIALQKFQAWAQEHTTEADTIVMEASGNSFYAARLLRSLNRQALVLESCRMGKLKEVHANNDKISAVRIAKAYLAGTAKTVWVPDLPTQQKRDIFHTYQKAVKRVTQVTNRLDSYLSDHGIRELKKGSLTSKDQEKVLQAHKWSVLEQQVLAGLFADLKHAEEQDIRWEAVLARAVIEDPLLLSLVRQCGVRRVIAFACGAIIGDIDRFESPKALVNYLRLQPAEDDSGEGKWTGPVGQGGRKDLRSLLVQGAQAVIKSNHKLGKWGRSLLVCKNHNEAVVAVARKIAVAVWYLMKGKASSLEELDAALERKLSKIVARVDMGKLNVAKRKVLKAEARARLVKGRTYVLDPTKVFRPESAAA